MQNSPSAETDQTAHISLRVSQLQRAASWPELRPGSVQPRVSLGTAPARSAVCMEILRWAQAPIFD